jgi:glycosyltransferase involved in cell wall biosynthesis
MSIEVIIGCYNQEKWLSDAIWSAQNQIMPAHNGSHLMPEKFEDYSIRVVHDNCGGKGSGASASRNRAIKESKYDWIIWLDADDMLTSNYLYKMYHYAQSFPSNVQHIYKAPVQFIEGARLDLLHSCPLFPESDNPLHDEQLYPMCMSAMFPRKAWKVVNGFDESLYNMNDLDFWVRCGYSGYKFIALETQMLRRNVPGSLIDKGAAMEKQILEQFNKKHGSRLTHKLLPYRVPMRNEC